LTDGCSKRAFQTQFKRWDFPSKQNPAHKNEALVERLKTLWEQNYSQKDMVDTLQAEGYGISDRELIRLRLRLKLLLRESAPRHKRTRAQTRTRTQTQTPTETETNTDPDHVTPAADESGGGGSPNDLAAAAEEEGEGEEEVDAEDAPMNPESVLQRQLRHQQLQLESEEKWRTRKRRRRTRGWAGLPADAPGEPPRFPSETTIDEAKAYLALDNNMYRQLREHFSRICEAEGVIKKTIAGPDKWAQIVRQLIREDAHLSTVFQQEPEVLHNNEALFRPKGQRALSLDVVCMDVTKRLRTIENRMTLAEAKNILGLNPEQTRDVRATYIAMLKADHFTNKYEAGEQHWADLKTEWVNKCELLSRALGQGDADPAYPKKLRALEVLSRDVMKRQQQERAAKDPSKKKQAHKGPGPGPAPPIVTPLPSMQQQQQQQRDRQAPYPSAANTTPPAAAPAISSTSDLQIDPSLLLAASDAAMPPYHSHYTPAHTARDAPQTGDPTQPTYLSHNGTYFSSATQPHTFIAAAAAAAAAATAPSSSPSSSTPASASASASASTSTTAHPPTPSTPLPVYFRLHPHSSTPFPSKTMWLSILHSSSAAELRCLATREHPGTVVLRLEGIVAYRHDGGGEREVAVEVASDDEVGAYLGHVREARGKAVFVVLVGGGEGFA
jgi:hypothetical protein